MESNFYNFYSILNTKISFVNDVKIQFSKTLASDFNAFNFWTVNENKVSEILSFFLNPLQSHGQNDLFLRLFLSRFNIDFDQLINSDIEVVTEKRTHNNRRIDIFISIDNGINIIGIENKIYEWTKDQAGQINDYLEYLKMYSKEKKFTLFYLAPKKKVISNNSFDIDFFRETYSENCLRFITYEDDIIPLVHEFAINSENDRVRSFLLDFERKLKNMYMGNSDINEKDIVKKFVTESKENLETSFKIFNNLTAIKNDLRERFYEQMIEISHELNVQIDENRNRFIVPKLGSLKIGISFEDGGLLYGIVREDYDSIKTTYPNIEMLFNENFQVSYWWSMWRWLFKDIEYSPDFWQSIIDGSVKNEIKVFVKKIVETDIQL